MTFTRFVIQTQRDAAVTTPPISNPTTPKVENKVELTSTTIVAPSNSRAKQEKRELEEAKRKLDEENRKIEAARQVEARRIEQGICGIALFQYQDQHDCRYCQHCNRNPNRFF